MAQKLNYITILISSRISQNAIIYVLCKLSLAKYLSLPSISVGLLSKQITFNFLQHTLESSGFRRLNKMLNFRNSLLDVLLLFIQKMKLPPRSDQTT